MRFTKSAPDPKSVDLPPIKLEPVKPVKDDLEIQMDAKRASIAGHEKAIEADRAELDALIAQRNRLRK